MLFHPLWESLLYLIELHAHVDIDIVAQTGNATLSCIYRCVSFKISHCITPTHISILELPSHSARSLATLSICLSPSSASSPLFPSTHYFPKISFPSTLPSSLLLAPPSFASSSQSALLKLSPPLASLPSLISIPSSSSIPPLSLSSTSSSA